jgi:hypothetical protein
MDTGHRLRHVCALVFVAEALCHAVHGEARPRVLEMKIGGMFCRMRAGGRSAGEDTSKRSSRRRRENEPKRSVSHDLRGRYIEATNEGAARRQIAGLGTDSWRGHARRSGARLGILHGGRRGRVYTPHHKQSVKR